MFEDMGKYIGNILIGAIIAVLITSVSLCGIERSKNSDLENRLSEMTLKRDTAMLEKRNCLTEQKVKDREIAQLQHDNSVFEALQQENKPTTKQRRELKHESVKTQPSTFKNTPEQVAEVATFEGKEDFDGLKVNWDLTIDGIINEYTLHIEPERPYVKVISVDGIQRINELESNANDLKKELDETVRKLEQKPKEVFREIKRPRLEFWAHYKGQTTDFQNYQHGYGADVDYNLTNWLGASVSYTRFVQNPGNFTEVKLRVRINSINSKKRLEKALLF